MRLKPGQAASLARLAITLLALGFLAGTYDLHSAASVVVSAGMLGIVGAIACYALCIVVGAAKWGVVLPGAPFPTLLHAVVASCFYSILPTGQLGGEISKILIVKARCGLLDNVTSSVIFDKLTGVAGLLLLCIAFLWIDHAHVPEWALWLVGAAMGACAATLLMAPILARMLQRPIAPGQRVRTLQARVAQLVGKAGEYAFDRKLLARSLAWGVFSQATVVATYLSLAYGLGIDASMASVAAVVCLANLAALLPISIGGFGVREVGITTLLSAIPGVTAPSAVALSLSALAIFLLAALAGALVELWFAGYDRRG